MPIQIEPTISFGNFVNILVSIGAVLVAFWRVAVRLAKLELKLNMLWNWFKRENNLKDDEED